jgi:hypothetical protein
MKLSLCVLCVAAHGVKGKDIQDMRAAIERGDTAEVERLFDYGILPANDEPARLTHAARVHSRAKAKAAV